MPITRGRTRWLWRSGAALGLGVGLAWAAPAVIPGGSGLPFALARADQAGAERAGESEGVPTDNHPFDANVRVTAQGDTLVVASDGIPTHKTGTFPNSTNPNRILKQSYRFYIPRHPQKAEKTTETPFGPIGVAINGIPFYNPYNAQGRDAVMGPFAEVFDSCCGHPDPMGRYHYHKYPECVKTPFRDPDGQHSPLIGLMFDGFALYGPNGESGAPPSDLDECNGHEDAARGYHYHVTAKYPYLIGAYRGTPDPRSIDRPRFPGRNGPLAFGGPGRMADMPHPPPHPLEIALDADRDGEISGKELAAASGAIAALDLDKDGQLDEQELIPAREHPPGGGGAERRRPLVAFAADDERDEREDGPPPPPPPPGRGRRRGDLGRDRGPREFDGPPPPGEGRGRPDRGDPRDRGPREFDGPPDGPPPPPPGGPRRVPGGRGPGGPPPPPPPPPPSPLLIALDRDRDGVLSSKEIAAASEALKELDRNGDGKLSREELRPPRPEGPPPGFGRGGPDREGPPPPPPRGGRGPRDERRPRFDRGPDRDRDEPPPPGRPRGRRPEGDRPPPPRDRDADEAAH